MGFLSSEWDETEFNIFILKDPDYNIMMMSNFSGLTVPKVQKEERRMVDGEVVKFRCPEVVAVHYICRGGVGQSQYLEA